MDYTIIDREAFTVVGRSIQVSTKDGDNLRKIPLFWQESHKNGTIDKLNSLGTTEDILGICLDMEYDKGQFAYMIAVESNRTETEAEGFTKKQIPASTWAVFASVGPMPGAIQKVWENIFKEFLPASGYKHAGGPELELYPPGDASSGNYRCEVWVPVVNK